MASLTHKLQTLQAKHAAGKRAVVKVSGVDHQFEGVVFGGTSPRVCLSLGGVCLWKSAAEWRALGAAI